MNFNPAALDRYITGNYGEDQFKDFDEDMEDYQPDEQDWEAILEAEARIWAEEDHFNNIGWYED